MADNIELVIRLSKDVYNRVANTNPSFGVDFPIYYAIKNGKPLPKGHGRLIDADAELEGLRKMKVVDEKDEQSVRFAIIEYENALTIVEADKAESEE